MHWTAEQLICLYFIKRQNNFDTLKLYLIISSRKLGMTHLTSVGFSDACPVYYTVERQPSLQVFGIGIPLLCWFNCLLFLFLFRPYVMVCEMFVFIGMQLQLHKHHYYFKVLATWTPGVVACSCCCLAVKQLQLRDCMVHRWVFHPPSTTTNMLFIAWSIVACDLFQLKRESTMHCLQTLLYLSALTAVQSNVCHANGVFVQRDL